MDENTGEIKKFDVYTVLLDPKTSTEKDIKLEFKATENNDSGSDSSIVKPDFSYKTTTCYAGARRLLYK